MQAPRSQTLPDLLDEIAMRLPDRDFIAYDGAHISYSAFRERVRALARSLHASGVRKGDKVAVLMGNRPEWLLVTFATTLLGATFVALNTWWRSRELEYALELSDTKLLIVADRYGNNDYIQALAQIGDLSRKLPLLRTIVCLSDARIVPAGMIDFDAFVESGRNVADATLATAQEEVTPTDIAFILFTSGSTAHPKAVQNQHWGLIRNLFNIGERMHLTEADRVHVAISLFWGFGIANAVFAIMTHGACIVLQHRFDAGEALNLLDSERCTALYATPNMVLAIASHPDRTARDLTSLRTGLGMPAAVALMIEIGAAQACSLYGLTECYGNSAVSDAAEPARIRTSTCGQPLPDTEIVIADPVTHAALSAGEVGEIKLRGFVMPGYYKDPQKTSEAIDGDGYFLTGDLGMRDADGYLHFRGRLKEMVKTGGINVSPAEVEQVLHSHPAVQQALVVGIPDAVRDEVLVAGVVLKDNTAITADALASFCRAEMALYKIPRHFVFLEPEAVPLTDTGKPDKRTFQRRVADEYARPAPVPAAQADA